MPWKETCAMDQKMQMMGDWLRGEFSITDLSEVYEVSRNTIYRWIERYEREGPEGLQELSRAPQTHANATPAEIAEAIVAAKMAHPNWGPKKVMDWMRNRHPMDQWPANSTAGEILKRAGLVKPRKVRRRTPPYGEPFTSCDEPNQVWSADYKGQFRMGDGRFCYPLTISDNCSRYLLACRGLSRPTFDQTRPWFEKVFREKGLPDAIRTDNGAPFASVGLGGLSKLSVWFIKLGIRPERIATGHPEQNGRHERMHRTLKQETTNPPKGNLRQQQKAFEAFKYEYNFERPHEALGQKPPASLYKGSRRPYPVRVPKVEYDHGDTTRQVRSNGEIKWKGDFIYVSEALAREPIALHQRDDHLWEVWFSSHLLGTLNELTGKILSSSKRQYESVNHVPGSKC
jgi:putative transposase